MWFATQISTLLLLVHVKISLKLNSLLISDNSTSFRMHFLIARLNCMFSCTFFIDMKTLSSHKRGKRNFILDKTENMRKEDAPLSHLGINKHKHAYAY